MVAACSRFLRRFPRIYDVAMGYDALIPDVGIQAKLWIKAVTAALLN
jgi:hypothetical protein